MRPGPYLVPARADESRWAEPNGRQHRSGTTAMTDLDKDRDAKLATDEELPGDDEFDEEPDEYAETEAERADREAEESAPAGERRRFGFSRGRDAYEEPERHAAGSVRESHDRVHIDDRPSAIFAIVCAAALLGVLALTWISGAIPQGTGPTLTPLVVPTSQPTPSTSASASASVAPSVSPSPTAAPTAAPTASPT